MFIGKVFGAHFSSINFSATSKCRWPTLKQPYGRFRDGRSQGGQLAAVFYTFGHPMPYAVDWNVTVKVNFEGKKHFSRNSRLIRPIREGDKEMGMMAGSRGIAGSKVGEGAGRREVFSLHIFNVSILPKTDIIALFSLHFGHLLHDFDFVFIPLPRFTFAFFVCARLTVGWMIGSLVVWPLSSTSFMSPRTVVVLWARGSRKREQGNKVTYRCYSKFKFMIG
jgi:hypothetical protein